MLTARCLAGSFALPPEFVCLDSTFDRVHKSVGLLLGTCKISACIWFSLTIVCLEAFHP